MARRRGGNNDTGSCIVFLFMFGIIGAFVGAVASFIVENSAVLIVGAIVAIIIYVAKKIEDEKKQKELLEEQRLYEQTKREWYKKHETTNKQRRELLREILSELNLENFNLLLRKYDDQVTVKSAKSLYDYTDYVYIGENHALKAISETLQEKKEIVELLSSFLKENSYKTKPQYDYIEKQLLNYANMPICYNVKVIYITPAGNKRGEKNLSITEARVAEAKEHPELLMTKEEYDRIRKQQAKEELNEKKRLYCIRVNSVIEFINNLKEHMVAKSLIKKLDELEKELSDKTRKCIQRAKTIDSNEWWQIDSIINSKSNQINKIAEDDKQISDYYASENFAQIKKTCNLLMESQKEFNEYIEEKAESITKLLGRRAGRGETQYEYTYNYKRPYNMNISPFTAEVSASVIGNVRRKSIEYVIKYFYPNKDQYNEQIQNLRVLIEELETLNEAKVIIDNYKKDYDKYIKNVPKYVMENDEDGFFYRLGLTILDEAVLNVKYWFIYRSNAGLNQITHSVEMNEENITELIYQLESKLSLEAQAKEQRTLMTSKLRAYIKERDNYTCCQCGNSIYAEPNLLLEIDHIIPVSRGGLTQKDNLQTLCWKCNRTKGAKMNYSFS